MWRRVPFRRRAFYCDDHFNPNTGSARFLLCREHYKRDPVLRAFSSQTKCALAAGGPSCTARAQPIRDARRAHVAAACAQSAGTLASSCCTATPLLLQGCSGAFPVHKRRPAWLQPF